MLCILEAGYMLSVVDLLDGAHRRCLGVQVAKKISIPSCKVFCSEYIQKHQRFTLTEWTEEKHIQN